MKNTASAHGQTLQIIKAVQDVNDAQKSVLTTKVVNRFGEDLTGKIIAIWGLAFKPNTDDMRDAPSREIIAALIKRGAKIQAHDPVALHRPLPMPLPFFIPFII